MGGDPRRVTALLLALEGIFDAALNEYARDLEILVDLDLTDETRGAATPEGVPSGEPEPAQEASEA